MEAQRIETHLYSVEAPTLFEKRLVVGQLLRLERMDRAEGEGSFAEVNLFVGFTDAEEIEDPPLDAEGGAGEALLDVLWQRYEETEARLGSVRVEASQRGAGERTAVVQLEATSWRPLSGQFVWISVLPAAGRHVFARLVLEFDWSLRERYEGLGRGLVASLEWIQVPITERDVELQSQFAWSAFDDMDPEAKASIAARYREVLGQSTPQVALQPKEKAEPNELDLTAMDLDALTLEELDASFVPGREGERLVMLKTAFLPDAIELTLEESMHDSYVFGPGTLALVRALGALSTKDHARAGELLWEHCQMCFEATDYGAGSQSNEDYFGIHGPEEALAQVGKGTIYMCEVLRGGSHDLFQISFYPPWEYEHGCSLVVRNGALFATSEPGGWLAEFELDPS